MLRRTLKKLVDENAVKRAIGEAERQSSGEIRVSVSTYFWGDVRKTAEAAFTRLGMDRTAQRNGILFFVVPSRRAFVVLGDEGIHAKVGQAFWDAIAAAMSDCFRKGDFTGGLIVGITEAGKRLAEHFPHQGESDRNELSNEVDFGGQTSQS